MFKEGLKNIIAGNDLSEEHMSRMIAQILSGSISPAQIGAFMGALSTKGETFEELTGAAKAMRRKAKRIQTTSDVVLDTCGTGGDGANTFNISTTTAFVVAACGVTVAKHGNRSVSSQCGSADLLEALGVNLDLEPESVEEGLREINLGFLFAPLYHGAMKFAATARKEVGIRSVFNMLGPLTNPAGANCQLLGVYAPELTEMFAQALQNMGCRRAFVVHGHDGLDEISLCAPTRITELNDGRIKTYDFSPEQFFSQNHGLQDLSGGSPAENADKTRSILNGDKGPGRDVVLLNAAAALVAAGNAERFREGIGIAAQAIDTGAATAKLQQLIAFNQSAE